MGWGARVLAKGDATDHDAMADTSTAVAAATATAAAIAVASGGTSDSNATTHAATAGTVPRDGCIVFPGAPRRLSVLVALLINGFHMHQCQLRARLCCHLQ